MEVVYPKVVRIRCTRGVGHGGESLSVWSPRDNRVSELWESQSPETTFSK